MNTPDPVSVNDIHPELHARAVAVRERAHAPYSGFRVGAALLDEKGRIHVGCNVENAAYPQGLCAEAIAIGTMIAAGGGKIRQLCIVAEARRPVTPCGGCRQKIMEFGDTDPVIFLGDTRSVLASWQLSELLPHAFHADDLEAKS